MNVEKFSSDAQKSPQRPPPLSSHSQAVQKKVLEMQPRPIVAERKRSLQKGSSSSEEEQVVTPTKKSTVSQSSKVTLKICVVDELKRSHHAKDFSGVHIEMNAADKTEYGFWKKVLENGEDEILEQLCSSVHTGTKPSPKWGNIAVPFKYTWRWNEERAAGHDSASINEKLFWQKVMEEQESEARLLQVNETGKWEKIRVPCKFWHPLNEERERRKAAAAATARMNVTLMEGAETAQKVQIEDKKKKRSRLNN